VAACIHSKERPQQKMMNVLKILRASAVRSSVQYVYPLSTELYKRQPSRGRKIFCYDDVLHLRTSKHYSGDRKATYRTAHSIHTYILTESEQGSVDDWTVDSSLPAVDTNEVMA